MVGGLQAGQPGLFDLGCHQVPRIEELGSRADARLVEEAGARLPAGLNPGRVVDERTERPALEVQEEVEVEPCGDRHGWFAPLGDQRGVRVATV